MSCLEPGTPCNLLDPEAAPVVEPVAPAPAPLLDPDPATHPGPWAHTDITDTDRYLHAEPDGELDLTGASAARVVEAIGVLLDAAFLSQRDGADLAFEALGRRVEPANDWLGTIIAKIAEIAVGVTLGQVASLIAFALPVSEDSKGISSQLGRVASSLGKSAGQAVRASGSSGAKAITKNGLLLDEYRARVGVQLNAAQATGRAQLVLSAEALQAVPASALKQMVTNLNASMDNLGTIASRQHDEIMLGWVQLSGAATLGKRAADEPEVPEHLTTAPGLDGFVDIFISCPDRINGVKGCKLERVVVNSHPTAVATLKDRPVSLRELPVYRKIFISSLAPQWAAGPSYVLSPDGAIQVMPGATALAAIGSGREAGESEIGPWVDGYDDRHTEAQRQAAADFQDSLWLGQALVGVTLVNDMLDRTQLKDFK